MELHRCEPGPPLDRFVDHCWLVDATNLAHPRQVLFPDGGVTVHFNLADAPGLVDRETGSVRRYPTSWISGERTAPYTLDTPGRVRLLGVRFRPGAVFPFLGFPAREVTGEVLELDLITGGLARETHERLLATERPAEAFGLVLSMLRLRMRRALEPPPSAVSGGLRTLDRTGPGASIAAVAAELGVSQRTLLRHFDRWVGVSPKTAQRIRRFQRVIEWEDGCADLDWSRVAYRCGYYDQAHLIRDFRAFTGTTPTAYRAERLAYPNYVPAERS